MHACDVGVVIAPGRRGGGAGAAVMSSATVSLHDSQNTDAADELHHE